MSLKVLILEGNPVTRAFLARVIDDSFSDALQLVEAGDVASAQRGVDDASIADPFKLILVDLELPEAGVLTWLRSLCQYPAIKVVTTLHSDDDHVFPALQGGADGYLLKEDRFESLVEAMQKIVRGQPPLSPSLARRLLKHFDERELTPFATTLDDAADALRVTERLTDEQRDLLSHLSKGYTVKEIANQMSMKRFMVNDHIKRIYRKLNGVSSTSPAGESA